MATITSYARQISKRLIAEVNYLNAKVLDNIVSRVADSARQQEGFLTSAQTTYLARRYDLKILDPRSTFIGKTVKIGRGTTIWPNVFIRGKVEIGENCEIGFGGGAVIVGRQKGIEIGNRIRITRNPEIPDGCVLEDGSQVLGPITLPEGAKLNGGSDHRDPDINNRGAVVKGGVKVALPKGSVGRGEVIDGFYPAGEIGRQIRSHFTFSPTTEEKYRRKTAPEIIAKFTEAAQQDRTLKGQAEYLRRALTFCGNNIVFGPDNRPEFLNMENIRLLLGAPLPSSSFPITTRLQSFQNSFAQYLGFRQREFLFTKPTSFHVTLFNCQWQKGEQNPTPHPIVEESKKQQNFIQIATKTLAPFGPVCIYFRHLTLFQNGTLVACGYSEEAQPDPREDTFTQMIRQCQTAFAKFQAGDIQLTHPDLPVIVVGRLLRTPTQEEFENIAEMLTDFNKQPLGLITFPVVRIVHQQLHWFQKFESLAEIPLVSGQQR